MDWRSVNFDWNRARAFLITAEEGSFSAAARALNMAQPTLGRQVSALEEELGVTLFERVGKGLELTQAGLHLIDHVRRMGEAANAVSLAASGQSDALEGHVSITASEIYSGWILPPVLRELRARAPGVIVEIVASNDLQDLKRREADIAIRNGRPDQPDLIGRLVCEDQGTLYATPDYLSTLAPITSPADLAQADFIGFERSEEFLAGLQAMGVPITMEQFRARATTHTVHWQLARAGLGIGAGPIGLGDQDPTLRRVLNDFYFDYPVWLVAHRELRTSPRVRLVWDVLLDMLPNLLKT